MPRIAFKRKLSIGSTSSSSTRKRQKLDVRAESSTCYKLLNMVSHGRISICGAVDLANSMVDDGMIHPAIENFATLGSQNQYPANAERDLHRWLRKLFGFRLQPYTVWMNLTVDGIKPRQCPVKCLLPHEILHSLSEHPVAFRSLVMASETPSAIKSFWEHCRTFSPWACHPLFDENENIPLDKTIAILFHGDGAQFYREDEMFVFSISSLFAPTGVIQDILLYKFPFLVIPERFMRSEAVAKHVNQTAAELAAWSFKWAMQGKAPDTGFTGEELKGFRLEMKGQPIGNSFRPI